MDTNLIDKLRLKFDFFVNKLQILSKYFFKLFPSIVLKIFNEPYLNYKILINKMKSLTIFFVGLILLNFITCNFKSETEASKNF